VKSAAKRVAIEALGWILVVVGIAALILPGPGLLALFAGVALLATQYEWAERRVDPVRKAALRTAADSVKSWPRILLSALGVAWLVGFGILWVVDPAAPSWWPVDDKWWLVGGWATGATLIGSGILAGAMIVYSFRNFRDVKGERPATPAALD
jgi:Putative transmembrane protein (PGPGW)